MNVDILNKEMWNEDEINKRSAKLATEFIKIFPYPEFEITEDEDVYSHINLNNDSIANPEDFIFTKPLEVIINNETFNKLSNWNKVLEEVFLYLYNSDSDLFMKSAAEVNKEFGYQTDQIAYTSNEMRAPYEFTEGVFVEENTSTTHKLTLMQRIINKMKLDYDINITYEVKNNQ